MPLTDKVIWSDLAFEQQAKMLRSRPKDHKKLADHIKRIKRDPDSALKLAEPLKEDLSGLYSLKINRKDRLEFTIRKQNNEKIKVFLR